ncbi:MAG: right-handed parallel beta-helix repeat-containing protein [Proteobacteria bacterium]|nr:right-handed parallel beta-helix repeat-containing protein [Pseudomonadota bacterium]
MKKHNLIFLTGFLISGCLIAVTGVNAKTIGPQPIINTDITKGTLFASPTGTGTTCSKLAPCNIWNVVNKAGSGDVIFLRGGTYTISKNLNFYNQGSATAPIIFESYPGESAVLDGGQNSKGTNIIIGVTGKFIYLRNIEVRNMPMQGIWISGTDNILDGAYVHHSGLSGIQVFSPYDDYPYGNYGSRNIIRNCTVHDNSGAGIFSDEFANGGNSDGISISSGANNRVENCLVYSNSDDGIDAWRSTGTYIGYNISHSNGIADGNGNGIKGGGYFPSADTTIEHNLSYSNIAVGIDYNGNVNATLLNNTTWNNLNGGYSIGSDTTITHNIASEGKIKYGTGIEIDNSWQRTNNVAFISTDPGSTNFLVPEINHGLDDIGAYVNTTNTTSTTNTPPSPLFPDVIVTQVSYANGIFTSTIKNQGAAATPTGVTIGVGYSVDGNYATWGDVTSPLAAGASVTIGTRGGSYAITKGVHTVTAYVDDANRFAESNENNNQLSQVITSGTTELLPDVIVTQVSYANGIFMSTVKNQGTAATPEGITIGVGYSVNGNFKTWGDIIGPLAAGESVTIGTRGGSYTIPNGTHTITAYVDDVNRFMESNETNNQLSRSLTVQ